LPPTNSTEHLTKALGLMTTALKILDEEKAAGDIGAHLDLAIERLRQSISTPSPDQRRH
jgi:hypothetical protein